MGFKVCFSCLLWVFCIQAIAGEPIQVHLSVESYNREKALDQLQLLIQKRLAVMHEVARTKWNENLKIEDLEREGEILSFLVKRGEEKGLDPKWTRLFFQAQMDAAKEIQKRDFALWHSLKVSKFEGVFNLKTELRAYIDQINIEMMGLLTKISDPKVSESLILDCPISIRESDGIDKDVWAIAIAPFCLTQN